MNYIFYTNEGEIKSVISCPEDLFQYQNIPENCQTLQTESAPLDVFNYYVDNGVMFEMAAKPDSFSKFDYVTKQWTEDQVLAEYKVRSQRDTLLLKSDWTDTASAPNRLGNTVYDEWQTYRQALRDVTSQSGFPFNVFWPVEPQ